MAFSRPDSTAPPYSIAFVVVAANQDFAFAGVVRLTDNAFLFHPLHQGRGAIIADLQPPLNVAWRRLAIAGHDLHGLAVEIGGLRGAHPGRIEDRAVLALDVILGGHGIEVLRRALGLEMADYFSPPPVGHERPVTAADAAAARHIE